MRHARSKDGVGRDIVSAAVGETLLLRASVIPDFVPTIRALTASPGLPSGIDEVVTGEKMATLAMSFESVYVAGAIGIFLGAHNYNVLGMDTNAILVWANVVAFVAFIHHVSSKLSSKAVCGDVAFGLYVLRMKRP